MKKITMKFSVLLFAIVVLWLKTNYVQSTIFELPIENSVQALILGITPISSILLVIGISILFGNIGLVVGYTVLTFVLYANVLFYREMDDYITIPVLMQTSNASTLTETLSSVMQISDILYWFDVLILIGIVIWTKKRKQIVWKKRQSVALIYAAIFTFLANMGLAETERTDILTRSFDRQILIKSIGVYNYMAYDGVIQTKTSAQRAMADSNELNEVMDYVQSNPKTVNESMTGVAKGRNVYVISLESTQAFVIDNKLHGEEITPFLNKLKNESIYFDNFYHQVGQGKTSDSEFLLENSLYPLDRGAVFFTHATNKYLGLPNILNDQGYYTAVMHANDSSFWNRDAMYPSLGYQKFFDVNSFDVNEENSVGWGLKDKDMFTQSVKMLKDIPQPHYVKFITLTNHFPFTLDKEDTTLEAGDYSSNTLNRYFQTVRYEDEAIELFIKELKENGLYDNSIIILYGDHYGISDNHTKAMEEYLGYDIDALKQFELQKVPMIIHIPGVTTEYTDPTEKVNTKVSGEIDIRPTILNLLGIEDTTPITFGEDLLSPSRESFVVERDGSVANSDVVYTANTCYDKHTGDEISMDKCEDVKKHGEKELMNSNKLIYGDLFRFIDSIKTTSKTNRKLDNETQKNKNDTTK